jgi:hypothetical protein
MLHSQIMLTDCVYNYVVSLSTRTEQLPADISIVLSFSLCYNCEVLRMRR